MNVLTSYSELNRQATIHPTGPLNAAAVKQFRKAYRQLPATLSSVTIDMAKVDDVDSSGLGMLLNVRQHFSAANKTIRLTHLKPALKELLVMCRFDEKFMLK